VTAFSVYAVVAVVLFVLGLHRLVTDPNLLRKVLSVNVMGAGVFLLLVATAYRNRAPLPDAVPHAMVLTGIVVAVSMTGFSLVLMRRLEAATGKVVLDEIEEEE
jgi:multicomponent Na+:H+ antiporter subunit C